MGIIEDISATLNRGASVTAKTANVLKLKAQIADVNNQRKNLCTGLGDALYERTKDISAMTSGLEDLYQGIANCDERIAALQAQVDQIEAQDAAEPTARASWMRTCPNCGYSMSAKDKFCGRCGMPLAGYQGWAPGKGGSDGAGQSDSSAAQPQQPGSAKGASGNAPIDVNPS